MRRTCAATVLLAALLWPATAAAQIRLERSRWPIVTVIPGGTVRIEMAQPSTLAATPSQLGTDLAAGVYTITVTAIDAGGGQTDDPTAITCTVAAGGAGRCALTWDAVPGAVSYRAWTSLVDAATPTRYFAATTNAYNLNTLTGATVATLPTANTAYVVFLSPSATSWLDGPVLIEQNAIGTTTTKGFDLVNNTAAAAGAQQYSPANCLKGFGWKTNATAGSQAVETCVELRPVQGGANPTFNLVTIGRVNGGAWSDLHAATSAGAFNINNPGSILFPDILNVGGGIYLAANNPNFRFDDQTQGADDRLFDIIATGNQLLMRTMNNAGTVAGNAMVIDRTGTTIDSVTFPNGNVGIGTTAPGITSYSGKVLTVGPGSGNENAIELYGSRTGSNGLVNEFAFLNSVTGVAEKRIGAIRGERIGADSSGGLSFWTINSGTFGEKVRIDNNGNVGIGTTDPTAPFVVNHATTGYMGIQQGGTFRGYLGAGNQVISGGAATDFGFQAPTGNLLFATNGSTERMRIDTTGNVGIGTTTPLQKQHIEGTTDVFLLTKSTDANSRAAVLVQNDARQWLIQVEGANSDNWELREGIGGNTWLSVQAATGNFGVGTLTPPEKLSQGTTNGATWGYGQASELLTLSTSGTTSDTTANLLPANSIIESVVARVTTTITTATSWQLGDATTAGRFTAANSTMTAGTTGVGLVHVDVSGAGGPRQTAAAKVRVTTVGTPGAGAIRITVFYRTLVPPTS